jgi:general secretion pathway protein J
MIRGRNHRDCRGRTSAGFTLIELLVALTLLGLVSVILLGGLRFGTRAWEASNTRAERLAEVQAIQGLLRRRLAQVVLPKIEGGEIDSSEEHASFVGTEDALRFVALVPSRIGVGGFYLFELSVTEGDDASRLELAWRLFRPDEPQGLEEPEPGLGGRRVLIEGIERVAFGYYGAEGAGQAAEWHDRWDQVAGLPALVALEVAFPAGDPRFWPDLVVAPKMSTPTP